MRPFQGRFFAPSLGILCLLFWASGCRRTVEAPSRPPLPAAQRALPPREKAQWLNNRGVALMEEGRFEEASREFQAALKSVPGFPYALLNLALCEGLQGKTVEARQRIQQSLTSLPSAISHQAYYILAWLAEKEGNHKDAAAYYAMTAFNFPRDWEVPLRLLRAYWKIKDWNTLAKQVCPSLLSREPSRPEVHEAYAEALEALGEAEKAAFHRRRAQELKRRQWPRRSFSPLDDLGPLGQPFHAVEPFTTIARQERHPLFRDVAASAGIAFQHGGGVSASVAALWRGEPLPAGQWERLVRWELPAALGSGVAFGDVDNDGDLDLYIANAGPSPARCRNALYRNNGDGTFTDITEQAGVGGSLPSLACVFADVNNDGYLDIFVTNAGPNDLYLNQGDGTFRNVAAEWGVAGGSFDMGAAFADVDGDGDLDLYVCGFLDLGARPAGSTFTDADLRGFPNRLYLNEVREGKGFREVGRELGVDGGTARSLGALFTDIEGDGDPDLLVVNWKSPPLLFLNEGGAPFRPYSEAAGLKGLQGFHGGTCGDFNQDGFPDFYLAGGQGTEGQLVVNRRDRTFETTFRLPEGVPKDVMGTGGGFLDLEGDGDLDLIVAQGAMTEAGIVSSARLFAFRNTMGLFEDLSDPWGLTGLIATTARGLAFGDYDNNGTPDLAVVCAGGPLLLLRNEIQPSPPRWLKVRLHGLGARVEVKSGTCWQVKEVQGVSGFLSTEAPEALFLLGDRETVDFVRIFWPSGRRQALMDVPTNQVLMVKEPQ